VGLYTAGTAIVTSYIGLIFSAIATDYFPRLAATRNNEELSVSVRTQAELTISLLAPLVVAFIVFCKPVIILLYSDQFLPIEYMMYWSIGAVLIQAMG
jgi:PST family polysaccharide transporter